MESISAGGERAKNVGDADEARSAAAAGAVLAAHLSAWAARRASKDNPDQ